MYAVLQRDMFRNIKRIFRCSLVERFDFRSLGLLVEIAIKSLYLTVTTEYACLGTFGVNFSKMLLDVNIY